MNNQKIKPDYDAVLMWSVSANCNLDCAYCNSPENTSNKTEINLPLLIKTLANTHKILRLDFTGGGEPFLVPNFIQACERLTQRHYISLTTNLTLTDKVREFTKKIDPKRVTFILASAHLKELEDKNLLASYFNNFLLLKNNNFKILAREVAHPSLLLKVKSYKKVFLEKGIELSFNPFRGEYQGKNYPFAYTVEETETFGIKPAIHYQYKKICNAGYNALAVLPNGDIRTCFHIPENLGNIYQKIKFKKNLVFCPASFCGCPFNMYFQDMFNQVLSEVNILPRKIRFYHIKLLTDKFIGQLGIFFKKYVPKLYYFLRKIKNAL